MVCASTLHLAKKNIFSQLFLPASYLLLINSGFTPQYKGLEALYKKFKDRGFVILGFPCNQVCAFPSSLRGRICQLINRLTSIKNVCYDSSVVRNPEQTKRFPNFAS